MFDKVMVVIAEGEPLGEWNPWSLTRHAKPRQGVREGELEGAPEGFASQG